MLIVEKMLVFLILLLVGLLLAKVRMLDEPSSCKLSALVLFVANPALIIGASQAEHVISGAQLLVTLLIAVLMFAALVAVAAVLPKLFRLSRDQENAYTVMTVFSNVGYLGVPLVNELVGGQAVLYVSVFVLMFNVMIYTYGVMILQRGADKLIRKVPFWRKLINPGVLSSIVAVALYLLDVRLPQVINTPLSYLSGLTAPLSMIVIGVALAQVKLRVFLTDWKLLVFSAVKLLALPIVFGLVLKMFIGGGDLLSVCIIMMSAPVGSMTVMMAQEYGGDGALLSRGVTLTTVLCIATIPLVFALVL